MDNNSNIRIMKFQEQQYILNQADLFEFINNSKPGEYMAYYDKLIFHTEKNGFIAAYNDDLLNYWSI